MKAFFKKIKAGILLTAPTFLKGVIVGLGAIAPGLSGSILLVIFGLYQKIVNTVSNIFKDFKKNLLFLVPLALGIGVGVIVFAKVIKIPLDAFPMQTNYAFLGLILGAMPMLWREVRREGFKPRHYFFSAGAFIVGGLFFILSYGRFPDITEPSFFESVILGLAVACAYLIPGVDSFAILSSFGLYNLWIDSIDAFDFGVLLPAVIGLAIGGIAISLIFNKLLSKFYTGTYSIVFGLFIAVILNFTIKECIPKDFGAATIISLVFLVLGIAFSYAFSHIQEIVAFIKKGRDGHPKGSEGEEAE